MGATVLTGKRAEAMVANDGTVLYLLAHHTYEKNCYPHKSRWGWFAFGTYAEVMTDITTGLSDLEGGMLQSKKGWIRPENYIAAWRRELKSPCTSTKHSVLVGWHLFKPWHDDSDERAQERLNALLEALEPADLSSWRAALENCKARTFEVAIAEHHQLVRLLMKHGAFWRMFESSTPSDTLMVNPPPLPSATGTATFPKVQAYRCDHNQALVSIDGGSISPWGWDYSAVGRFCNTYVVPAEQIQPGISKKAIPTFRELLKSAPELPDDTIVTVHPNRFKDASDANVPYRQRAAAELANALQFSADIAALPSWKVRLGRIKQAEHGLYKLFSLDEGQVEFHVPFGTEAISTPNELQPAAQVATA